TAVSVALGAGLALSKGEPIQDVMMDSVKGALPGQPASTAAFDMVQTGVDAAMEHKPFTWKTALEGGITAVGAGLDLPPAAANAMNMAINLSANALQKKTSPQDIQAADAHLKSAVASLPKTTQDA